MACTKFKYHFMKLLFSVSGLDVYFGYYYKMHVLEWSWLVTFKSCGAVGLDYLRSGNMASLVSFLRVSRRSVKINVSQLKRKLGLVSCVSSVALLRVCIHCERPRVIS